MTTTLLEARRTATEARENLESTLAACEARERENEAIRREIEELRRTARSAAGSPQTLLDLHRREGEHEAGAAQLETMRAEASALAAELTDAEARERWEAGVSDAAAIAHDAEALRVQLLGLAQAASDALQALCDAAPGMLARGHGLRFDFVRLASSHVADFPHPERRDGERAGAFLSAVARTAPLSGVRFAWDARPIHGQTLGLGSTTYSLGVSGEHRNTVTQAARLPEEPPR